MTREERMAAFPKGCHVKLSAKGHSRGFGKRGKNIGVVIGWGIQFDTLTIMRDGIRTRSSYHWTFWERSYSEQVAALVAPTAGRHRVRASSTSAETAARFAELRRNSANRRRLEQRQAANARRLAQHTDRMARQLSRRAIEEHW